MGRSIVTALLTVIVVAACAARPAAVPGRSVMLPAPSRTAVPQGAVRSFVPAWAGVFARVDLARMRGSVNGNGYADLVRLTQIHEQMLADVGFDPVEDLDRVIIASTSLSDEGTLIVIRHRSTASDVRTRVERETAQRGERARWSTLEGFRHAEWPCRSYVARRVVITAEREIVLTPELDLDDVVDAARDHLARAPDGRAVDPGWDGAAPGEIARVWATRGIPGLRALGGRAPVSLDFLVREAGIDRTDITLDLAFADAPTAWAAANELRGYAGLASREPMLAGLARVLHRMRVEQREQHALAFVRLSDDELGTALATLSLVSRLGGWGD